MNCFVPQFPMASSKKTIAAQDKTPVIGVLKGAERASLFLNCKSWIAKGIPAKNKRFAPQYTVLKVTCAKSKTA